MSQGTIRAVTFDAAGTLIATAEPVARVYARIASEHGLLVAEAALTNRFKEAFTEMPALAFDGATAARREHLERDWWRRLVVRVIGPEYEERPSFAAFFDRLYAHYAQAEAWRLFPEVRSTLTAIGNRGIKAAVVSNFDSRLEAILAGLGVAECFDVITYSTLAGAAKPDARIFAITLEQLGTHARAALHVGDDRRADYDGATGAGMHALLVVRRKPTPSDPGSIPTLDQVLEHV